MRVTCAGPKLACLRVASGAGPALYAAAHHVATGQAGSHERPLANGLPHHLAPPHSAASSCGLARASSHVYLPSSQQQHKPPRYFTAPRFDASRFAHAVVIVLATVCTWVGIWELVDSYIAYWIPWPCSLSPLALYAAANHSSRSSSLEGEDGHEDGDGAGTRRCYACYKAGPPSYPPCLALKAAFIVIGVAGLFHTRALYKDPKAAPRMSVDGKVGER